MPIDWHAHRQIAPSPHDTHDTMNQQPYRPDVSLAELAAVLSRAADLALGAPIERSLRVCLLAAHFGAALGMTSTALSDLYYAVLLRWVGCPAHVLYGDPLDAPMSSPPSNYDRQPCQALGLLHVLCDAMNASDLPLPGSVPGRMRNEG